MSIKRRIVDCGENIAHFFACELQNKYYKYFFISSAKSVISKKNFDIDNNFKKNALEFWKKKTGLKINPIWHNFYSSQNGIKDVRYIPENIYYSIIEPFYNRKEFAPAIDDKCFYSERFPSNAVSFGVKRPEAIIRNVAGLFFDKDFNLMTKEKAASKLSDVLTGYVIKESITGTGGNRIVFVEPNVKKTKDEILALFEKYNSNFIVEGIIEQCDEMKSLNPSSVNTIRFITFMDENDVHILSSVIRIGGKGSRTDNFATGGISAGIFDNGTIKSVAYNHQYDKFYVHPNGNTFAEFKIPAFDKAKELVTTLHRRFGHFRIISWDIAIGNDYIPIIIEFNITPQGIDLHQINNGPLFGELTDKIIEEVF